MTPEEKLERYLKLFKERHGDRYDYSMVRIDESIPQIAKQRVQVVCQEHGVFLTRIENHLNGAGCKLCAYKNASERQRISTADLIERIKSVHGDKYEYNDSNLEAITNTKNKVIITCKVHGDFRQRLNCHLSGKGCRRCANDAKIKIKPKDQIKRIDGIWRKRLRKSHCEICGQGDTWNGLPLTLEIDHIDGNRKNNASENLRTLCPNCHRQQVTSNKSKKKLKEVLMESPDLNPQAAKSLGITED
jgi:hypothetical protein